jgi:hypothetical protein
MKLGSATAFVAEAALWISGAALIASAAGMSWSVDVSSLVGSQASASASVSPSAGPSATVAVESLAPGASPTRSPIVEKYLAYVARPDFQFKAKQVTQATFTSTVRTRTHNSNGIWLYKGGDVSSSDRDTVSGAVSVYDEVDVGASSYLRINGGAWAKSDRAATDTGLDRFVYAPTVSFLDMGIETKNGEQLRRLVVVDSGAYSKAFLKLYPEATGAQLTFTVWVRDDGSPADFVIEGWETFVEDDVPTRMTETQEYRIVALSGVTITAPI